MIESSTDHHILSLMSDEKLFVSGKSPTSAVTEDLKSRGRDKENSGALMTTKCVKQG